MSRTPVGHPLAGKLRGPRGDYHGPDLQKEDIRDPSAYGAGRPAAHERVGLEAQYRPCRYKDRNGDHRAACPGGSPVSDGVVGLE